MGTLSEFLGGSGELSTAVDITLGARGKRVYAIEATAAGVDVALPDARLLNTGGPHFYIQNSGATNSFDLNDDGGTLIVALAPDEIGEVLLLNNSTADGEWRVKVENTASIPVPAVNDFFHTHGGTDTTVDFEVYKYDHVGDSWAAQTAATIRHAGAPCSTAAGGVGYVHGGSVGSGADGLENDKYDPDVWTVLTDCTTVGQSRFGANVDGLSDVYGRNADPNATNHEQYDTGADSWASGTALTQKNRHANAGAADDDSIYYFGGVESFGVNWTAVQRTVEHEPVGDSFTNKTNLPTDARSEHGAFVLGGKVYSICGKTKHLAGTILDRVDEYDHVGDSWTSRAAYTHGTTWQGPGASTRSAGVAYATGGESNTDLGSYTVDTWTDLAAHAASGSSHRGFQKTCLSLIV